MHAIINNKLSPPNWIILVMWKYSSYTIIMDVRLDMLAWNGLHLQLLYCISDAQVHPHISRSLSPLGLSHLWASREMSSELLKYWCMAADHNPAWIVGMFLTYIWSGPPAIHLSLSNLNKVWSLPYILFAQVAAVIAQEYISLTLLHHECMCPVYRVSPE